MAQISIKKVLGKILPEQARVKQAVADIEAKPSVVESGTSGIWTYRKWSNGLAECWGRSSLGTKAITTRYGNGYYASANTINFPSNFFNNVPTVTISSQDGSGYGTWFNITTVSKTSVTGYMYATTSVSPGITLNIHAVGKWG